MNVSATIPGMRNLMLALFIALGAVQLRAELTVKNYRVLNASKNPSTVAGTKYFIDGLGQGLGWAETVLELRKSERLLYCQPEKLSFGLEMYINIINKRIEKLAKLMTESKLEEMDI